MVYSHADFLYLIYGICCNWIELKQYSCGNSLKINRLLYSNWLWLTSSCLQPPGSLNPSRKSPEVFYLPLCVLPHTYIQLHHNFPTLWTNGTQRDGVIHVQTPHLVAPAQMGFSQNKSFCREPQQTLVLALACERLEIMNKNNNLWLSHFPPSHLVLDLSKRPFSGVRRKCTLQARRRRTCLFRWAHFPANISFGHHQLHLAIGPLVLSGHPNWEENC